MLPLAFSWGYRFAMAMAQGVVFIGPAELNKVLQIYILLTRVRLWARWRWMLQEWEAGQGRNPGWQGEEWATHNSIEVTQCTPSRSQQAQRPTSTRTNGLLRKQIKSAWPVRR